MARGPAQVHKPVEAPQVEGRDHARRAQQAVAVHAAQEIALAFLGHEKVVEDRAVHLEGLPPAVASFTDRVFKVSPQRVKGPVRILDVTRQGPRAGPAEISFGHRQIGVGPIFFLQQPQADARVEQPLQSVGAGGYSPGEARSVGSSFLKAVEHSQGHGRKHGFRAAKGFDEINNRSGVGRLHRSLWKFGISRLFRLSTFSRKRSCLSKEAGSSHCRSMPGREVLADIMEHFPHHFGRELAGLRVLLAGVIRSEQPRQPTG